MLERANNFFNNPKFNDEGENRKAILLKFSITSLFYGSILGMTIFILYESKVSPKLREIE